MHIAQRIARSRRACDGALRPGIQVVEPDVCSNLGVRPGGWERDLGSSARACWRACAWRGIGTSAIWLISRWRRGRGKPAHPGGGATGDVGVPQTAYKIIMVRTCCKWPRV